MNGALSDAIGAFITPLPWVDVYGGMSRTVATAIPTDDNKVYFKRYPVSCNTSLDDCKKGRYKDLVPDSKKRAILYWEDYGNIMQKREGDNFTFVARLKLIGWVNLEKFKNVVGCTLTHLLVASIIKEIPTNFQNFGIFQSTKIRYKGEDPKTAQIFAKYTYSEEVNQYLLYPFDYFAMNFEIEFTINQACDTDVEIVLEDGTVCS